MIDSRRFFHRAATLLAILLTASLQGCGSSPPASFYTLSPSPLAPIDSAVEADVTIGPIFIPEYLNRPQIVTRRDGSELKLAEFDRWAEPLDDSFQRMLTTNIGTLLDSDRIIGYPTKGNFGLKYQVVVDILRFDADQRGNAVLDVKWGILDVNRDRTTPARSGRFESRASNANDYSQIVAAMDDTVSQLSVAIARSLIELEDREAQ
jgi:hypothetical protein